MYLETVFEPRAQAVRQLPRGLETAAECARSHPLLSVMSGTQIPTPDGPVAAQSLASGDTVLDEAGVPVRVLNVSLTSCTRDAVLQARRLAPIRIEPCEDHELAVSEPLLLAPDFPVQARHCSDLSVPATALINGYSIRRVVPEEGIDYIRLTLARPATLAVGGLRLRFSEPADVDSLEQIAPVATVHEPLVFRAIS